MIIKWWSPGFAILNILISLWLIGNSNTFWSFCSVGTQIDADRVVSRLRIQGATNKDTGNYTCRIGDNAFDFPRGRVKVHVVDGNSNTFVLIQFISDILFQYSPNLSSNGKYLIIFRWFSCRCTWRRQWFAICIIYSCFHGNCCK